MSVHLYFCCPWFARWLAAIGHWSALINERPAGGAVSAKSGGWRAFPLGSCWRKSSCSRSKCPIEILGPGIGILDPYTIRLLGVSIKDRSVGPVASDCMFVFCICLFSSSYLFVGSCCRTRWEETWGSQVASICLFSYCICLFSSNLLVCCVFSERIVATPTVKQHEEVKLPLLLI